MKLSADSRWIRYAYWKSPVPEQTNLCELFWRTVAVSLIPLYVASLLGLYVVFWVRQPLAAAVVTGCIAFIGLVVAVALAVSRRRDAREWKRFLQPEPTPKPPSVIREALWAVKHRVCPLIEIERDWD